MIGVGPMEWLMVLLWVPMLSGVPLGLPPGPEDPVMAQMAPEECLFYATWSPRAAADPQSTNETEKLLAEPEVQRFVAVLQREIQRTIDRSALNANDPTAKALANLAPKLVTWLFTETGAVSVNSFAMAEQGPQVNASVIVRLGETGREIPGLLQQFHKFAPTNVQNVKIKGMDAHRITINPQVPEITWGVSKGYLVIGVGSGSLEQLLDRMNGKVPSWLAAMKANAKIDRRASLSYLNVAAISEIGRQLGGDMAGHYIDALGLSNVTTIESVTGLDEIGFTSRTLMRIDGDPAGVFAFANARPLSKDEFRGIPRDAYAAVVGRVEFSKLLTNAFDVANKLDPDGAAQLREHIRQFEDMIRLRIQEDVLDPLGDRILVYSSPSTGGFIVGWTAAIEIKNQKRLQSLSGRLAGMLGAGPQDRAPQVKRMTAHGEDIEYLLFPEEVPFTPAWCITENELIIGLFPQTIVGHLSNRDGKNSLVDHPALKDVWGEDGANGPIAVSYVDTQTLFSLAYPMLQMVASVGFSEARRNGIDLDVSLLPSSSALTPHLLPTVAVMRKVKDGIEFSQHQTLPGGSIGASAPISVALLLPAVQAAREAARRMQSTNNLKQLMLALHNYHDTYRWFPPAYSVNAEGEPLLSWRVHILPYVEQQALYDQFHLDEPWDSEHNKQLIAQIPELYRSPRSSAEPGMTNYLAVRSEKSAFPRPKIDNGKVRGVNLAGITDGTSNTVGIVEVNDQQAVIWTKPDDYEYDPKNPLAGVMGTWANVFLAAFCDGSVRAISTAVDPETAHAMFTRDGGEVVNVP